SPRSVEYPVPLVSSMSTPRLETNSRVFVALLLVTHTIFENIFEFCKAFRTCSISGFLYRRSSFSSEDFILVPLPPHITNPIISIQKSIEMLVLPIHCLHQVHHQIFLQSSCLQQQVIEKTILRMILLQTRLSFLPKSQWALLLTV